MKQCFGYVRVSTKKQGEGVSLRAQKEAIQHFADRNDISIVRWFEEQQTAAKRGRPQFNAMLQELRRKNVAGFVIHKVDRSSRNFFDWARIGAAIDTGTAVYAASGSTDFNSTSGRLQADIEFVFGAHYIRNLKSEIRKGQHGQLKEGLYPFKAPIGYLDNGKGKLKTLDPIRAPLVREAFKMYASGSYSTRTLRLELNERGLRNHSGGRISKGCLEKFLKNPFYTGIIKIRKTGEVYQGAHEPLIPAQLFEAVQEMRIGKCGKKVTRHNHTYRGLFKCQRCERCMIPERQKRRYVYYRCQNAECAGNCIREEQLEAAIVNSLKQVEFDEAAFAQFKLAFERWWQKRKRSDRCQTLKLQLDKQEAKYERLTDAVIDGLIDKDTFNRRKETLLLSITELKEDMAKAAKHTVSWDKMQQFLEHVKCLAGHYISAPPSEKREIAKSTLSNRWVSGKKVYLEPASWLHMTERVIGGFSCAEPRPKTRRQPPMAEEHIERLIDLAISPEAERLTEICGNIDFKRVPSDR